MRNVNVIIGAAGSGKRMGAPIPKQFLKQGGKTILAQTVEKFAGCDFVKHIVIVTGGDYLDDCRRLCQGLVPEDMMHVIAGGKERQDSVYNAILFLEQRGVGTEDIVLVHDGVRPYVSKEVIFAVAAQAAETGAAIAAVSPKDTIRHIDDGTLDRSRLCCVQTPQGFRFGLLKEAFEKAMAEGFYGTDDASLVERLGHAVAIVPGEYTNIKITTPEDLTMEMRIGTGYDVHKLVEDRALILGGVTIPYEKGLLGHSDADVLTHALMDALLGAAALGDIGKLFPDNDDSFKGISSIELLRRVKSALDDKGYSLGNADVTVICQKPKLAGYIDEMRKNIAQALDADIDRISIKATTTEKLGFTGRGEGIAAEAVCILNR
ncbi:MAG: 2-C-methyl-D-erythritol 2,4-cyclodiphosphate synthase [Firmicutes bacterium]|nr:2-C-methyl-D-erythritol 2,4-cyclodiphosphate synthase [Bacillota bacterium]